MDTPIVQDLPHLILDESSRPACLRFEDQTSLETLIEHGVSQRAGRFYRDLRLPRSGQSYLLEYHQADIDFALNYIIEKPWVLAHALSRNGDNRTISVGSEREIIQTLGKTMSERWRLENGCTELDEALRVLTWPGHDMPFRRRADIRQRIENAISRGILDIHPHGWRPAADPNSRMLLAVNHWRVLIDLEENFLASVDDQGKTVKCQQFEHRYQLLEWLVGVTGPEGQVRLMPWNNRMELPKLSLLGSLRSWTRHLCEAEGQERSIQMELDVEGGAWGWLGGRAAFCEPVRHRLQGNQEQRPELRLQLLMHQAGELVHPGFPEQPHRLDKEAPAVEMYRPVNPFLAADKPSAVGGKVKQKPIDSSNSL